MSLKPSGHFVRLANEFKIFRTQNPANRDGLPLPEDQERKEKKEN